MKIAIIGTGRIGAGLARAWARAGHELVLGARDPAKPEVVELAASLPATVRPLDSATQGAEVVVFAVPHSALEDVLSTIGPVEGAIVIDCTNAVQRGMTLRHGHTTSAAELLQSRLPQARVFKSFNAQGAENLADPVYQGVRASNFFCGDDAEAASVVESLIEDVGFEPVNAGPLKNARLLEPMMILWVTAAQALGTRDLAFKLMRR